MKGPGTRRTLEDPLAPQGGLARASSKEEKKDPFSQSDTPLGRWPGEFHRFAHSAGPGVEESVEKVLSQLR